MRASEPVNRARAVATRVLSIMDHGVIPPVRRDASPPALSPAEVAYTHVFHARWDLAMATAHASSGGSHYERALLAQIEALCTGAIEGGLPIPRGDPATVEGAMEVFHVSEAAHVVGDLDACVRITSDALAAGVTDACARLWVRLGLVRGLLFRGEVARATEELRLAAADATAPLAKESVRCLDAMITGFAGDRLAVVAVAEGIRTDIERPSTYADAGIALLGAMGLALCHLPHAAAELLSHGAGGAGLPLLPPALRAYGYDLLVEAAVNADNGALAAWIMHDFDRLDFGDNRQFVAAREGSRARLGGAGAMVPVTSAGSPLVDARALLAAIPLDATRREETAALLNAVSTDELRGWMERALRRVGAVPRPLPEIGWDLLTPAQQTAARLAARGLSNDEIARLLVVSKRTVEGHVAAVLSALGLPNRIALVRSAGKGKHPGPPAALTERQRSVAHLLVQGLGNGEIAAQLGVSVKAVEKHLRSIYRVLGVTTRSAAVARLLRVG